MKRITLSLFLLFFACGKQGLPSDLASSQPAPAPAEVNLYQIGDSWDRSLVTEELLNKLSAQESGLVMRTARVDVYSPYSTGTVFYLGHHQGKLIFGTASHVVNREGCHTLLSGAGRTLNPLIRFQNGAAFRCVEVLIDRSDLPDLDFSIFAAEPSRAGTAEPSLPGLELSSAPVTLGTLVTTAGFGFFKNPAFDLKIEQGSDCRIFSAARLLSDPDSVSELSPPAWSVAVGCDASQGDSGSAVVNRQNGKVVGVLWTGGTKKEARIQNSLFLQNLKPDDSLTWTSLTYMVPMSKILELLALKNPELFQSLSHD